MDYPQNSIETPRLVDEISRMRSLVNEIKSHLLEDMPKTEQVAKNPMADHKLINIRASLADLNRELESILQSVVSL